MLVGSGNSSFLLISAYFSQRGNIVDQLGELENVGGNYLVLFMGDFNCLHVSWGYSHSAPRRTRMLDFLILHDLVLANVTDGLSTFESTSGDKGNQDLTLTSQNFSD